MATTFTQTAKSVAGQLNEWRVSNYGSGESGTAISKDAHNDLEDAHSVSASELSASESEKNES